MTSRIYNSWPADSVPDQKEGPIPHGPDFLNYIGFCRNVKHSVTWLTPDEKYWTTLSLVIEMGLILDQLSFLSQLIHIFTEHNATLLVFLVHSWCYTWLSGNKQAPWLTKRTLQQWVATSYFGLPKRHSILKLLRIKQK